MTHLLALVLLVGIADSANPSTIAPALYLATGRNGGMSLSRFLAGVFLTNLAAGVVLALGPGEALSAIVPHPGARARHLIELAAGAAAFALAAGLWLARRRLSAQMGRVSGRIDRSPLLVGAGVMVVELPTALPYFAVIAVVIDAGRGPAAQVVLLSVFNAAFAAPLLAILAARTLAGDGMRERLERLRATLERRLATLVPALVLAVSLALLSTGGYGLLGER